MTYYSEEAQLFKVKQKTEYSLKCFGTIALLFSSSSISDSTPLSVDLSIGCWLQANLNFNVGHLLNTSKGPTVCKHVTIHNSD